MVTCHVLFFSLCCTARQVESPQTCQWSHLILRTMIKRFKWKWGGRGAWLIDWARKVWKYEMNTEIEKTQEGRNEEKRWVREQKRADNTFYKQDWKLDLASFQLHSAHFNSSVYPLVHSHCTLKTMHSFTHWKTHTHIFVCLSLWGLYKRNILPSPLP